MGVEAVGVLAEALWALGWLATWRAVCLRGAGWWAVVVVTGATGWVFTGGAAVGGGVVAGTVLGWGKTDRAAPVLCAGCFAE